MRKILKGVAVCVLVIGGLILSTVKWESNNLFEAYVDGPDPMGVHRLTYQMVPVPDSPPGLFVLEAGPGPTLIKNVSTVVDGPGPTMVTSHNILS